MTAMESPRITSTEFILLTRFFVNKGRQLDREATIERLKRRGQA